MTITDFNFEDFRAANIDDEMVRTAKRMIARGDSDDDIVHASTFLLLERVKRLRVRYLADKEKGIKPEEYI
ncbi:MAG: hypothetical protein LBO05_06535 [Deltaproteobacteria bacterium]|jgi:hypothetical protein|nr:hypothetical protein [Deltaproteobacteria bacterium]